MVSQAWLTFLIPESESSQMIIEEVFSTCWTYRRLLMCAKETKFEYVLKTVTILTVAYYFKILIVTQHALKGRSNTRLPINQCDPSFTVSKYSYTFCKVVNLKY